MRDIAAAADVPWATFNRRLRSPGTSPFSVVELDKIARFLGLTVGDMLAFAAAAKAGDAA